jgi:hypothetical protein
MAPSQALWLKQLEKGGARPKTLVANLSLDKLIVEDVLEKGVGRTRRRQLVDHVQQQLDVSQRCVCHVLKRLQSTQCYRESG